MEMIAAIRSIKGKMTGGNTGKPFLALDMGSDSVKIVQLEKDGQQQTIKNILYESRPDSSREITENEAIKRIVNKSGIKTDHTITTLPSREINEKFFRLHSTARDKLENILKWEVKKHINYPIEEAVYDYNTVSVNGTDELSVHLAITRRDMIINKIRSLTEAGFSMSAIETESRAIRRIVTANYDTDGTLAGVVNLGSSSSTFIIMESGELRFCRDMDVIGEDIDKAISKMLHVDREEAEIAKREIGLDRMVMEGSESEPSSVRYNVYSAIESQIDRLIAEINQSMHFYGIQSETDSSLDRLFVTGGNSLIPNLIPFMQGKLNTETVLFDPADFYAEPGAEPGKVKESLAQFTVAIGLGLRGLV